MSARLCLPSASPVPHPSHAPPPSAAPSAPLFLSPAPVLHLQLPRAQLAADSASESMASPSL
eukprot:3832869-Pleurochrysis_carterae.AAC.1